MLGLSCVKIVYLAIDYRGRKAGIGVFKFSHVSSAPRPRPKYNPRLNYDAVDIKKGC